MLYTKSTVIPRFMQKSLRVFAKSCGYDLRRIFMKMKSGDFATVITYSFIAGTCVQKISVCAQAAAGSVNDFGHNTFSCLYLRKQSSTDRLPKDRKSVHINIRSGMCCAIRFRILCRVHIFQVLFHDFKCCVLAQKGVFLLCFPLSGKGWLFKHGQHSISRGLYYRLQQEQRTFMAHGLRVSHRGFCDSWITGTF